MGKIKVEDIRFGKTDNTKGNRPTDIIISNTYALEDCWEICIIVSPERKGFVFLRSLYYMTSKKYHYFDLKKIEGWGKIKEITLNRFYRSGTDNRLRMDDLSLIVLFDKDGPRILKKKK